MSSCSLCHVIIKQLTTNTAIFVCGTTAEFHTGEELFSFEAMHSTTRGENFLKTFFKLTTNQYREYMREHKYRFYTMDN